MATRPPAIPLPMLRVKLGLLYLFSRRIKTDTGFGQAFYDDDNPLGIGAKAIRNWISGYDVNSGPDHVPADRFPRMVEIFTEELPGNRAPEEAEALLASHTSAGLLHAFFDGVPPDSWMGLVAGAGPADVALTPEQPPGGLYMTGRGSGQFEVTHDWVQVGVPRWFSFNMPARQGWVAAIQWGPEGWYAVELGHRTAVVASGAQPFKAPAVRPFLFEKEPMARRYLFLHVAEPFPPELQAILDTSAEARAQLDAATLTRLAWMKARASDFEITSLDVAFSAETPA